LGCVRAGSVREREPGTGTLEYSGQLMETMFVLTMIY
jgi:hypothetical protein